MLKNISQKYNLPFDELKAVCSDVKKKKKSKVLQEYVEMEEYMWKGKTYLIDDMKWVHTNEPSAPRRIGQKLIDGSIKFFEEYSE